MGDWYLRPDPLNPGREVWDYDKGAPTPDPTVTGMFAAVQPHGDEQDDLSHLDEATGELVNTEKLGPLDEVLIQPPQDPDWHNPREAS